MGRQDLIAEKEVIMERTMQAPSQRCTIEEQKAHNGYQCGKVNSQLVKDKILHNKGRSNTRKRCPDMSCNITFKKLFQVEI